MPPMGRILSLSALLHVSAATPFLTATLGQPEGAKMKIGPAYSPIALKFPEHAPTTADPCAAPCGLKTCGTVADVACTTLADAFGCSCDGCCRAAAPAPAATIEEPVGPNVELANRTHPGRGLEFATMPGRMTYSGNTGVNIDGGYAYGDPRRYTRGWELSNGLGDPALCDALCKAQPECQSPGNTCTSQAYQAPDRCYCSYASTQAPPCGTNQHVSNGRCVACPPGTTSSGGDDPSEGKDTGCECASTVTLGPWRWSESCFYSGREHNALPSDWAKKQKQNTHYFNPANGELFVGACVDTIPDNDNVEYTNTFSYCAQIKKVTFLHTVSNPVIIGLGAFRSSGVEVFDVPPRATFKYGVFGLAAALQSLVFRDDSDYSALKFESGAFLSSGLKGKEVLLCAPLICTSMPPSD